MSFFPKRSESTLVTAVLRYLGLFENRGDIVHYDRLNSGRAFWNYTSKKTGKTTAGQMRLCRPGTPDIVVFLKCGIVLWFECKELKGDQRQIQIDFENKVTKAPNHHYYLVRDTDEVRDILSRLIPDVMA